MGSAQADPVLLHVTDVGAFYKLKARPSTSKITTHLHGPGTRPATPPSGAGTLDTAEERISELGDMTIETSKTEKQRERKHWGKINK